jgi:A/G-specific adenine glycosylase
MDVSERQQAEFLEVLWEFYAQFGRNDLPWRQPEQGGGFDPYAIMVSELMLQQTQVARVIPKYLAFIERFPDAKSLARAELGEVLRAWQGLGYNRRAKFLWQDAQIVDKLKHFPSTVEELVRLPGIGVNTAGAILAYAYDQPVVFVETNIRTVYIHHFFRGRTDVTDKEILALVRQTLPAAESPREFYWALMDYGSHLKATIGNANQASKHYAKQPTFHGSRREIRGHILRLLSGGELTLAGLRRVIVDERLDGVLADLVAEDLVRRRHGTYSL